MNICSFQAGVHPVTVHLSNEETRLFVRMNGEAKPDEVLFRMCWNQNAPQQALLRLRDQLEHRFSLQPFEREQLRLEMKTVWNIVHFYMMQHDNAAGQISV